MCCITYFLFSTQACMDKVRANILMDILTIRDNVAALLDFVKQLVRQYEDGVVVKKWRLSYYLYFIIYIIISNLFSLSEKVLTILCNKYDNLLHFMFNLFIRSLGYHVVGSYSHGPVLGLYFLAPTVKIHTRCFIQIRLQFSPLFWIYTSTHLGFPYSNEIKNEYYLQFHTYTKPSPLIPGRHSIT